MFFAISKIFWLFAEPSNLFGLLLALAVLALWTRFSRAARGLLGALAAAYILCAFGPVSALVMRPLEDRFPLPGADMPAPDAIIVLGGAMDERISEARGSLTLSDQGSRMTDAVALSRRFPDARIYFTGGSADLIGGDSITEAEAARRLFTQLGVPEGRVAYEDRSRNTWENAVFTRDIAKPAPGQRFLLVTSAFHMPRSMGIFRKAGFDVTAWPANYMTSGRARDYWRPGPHAADSLQIVDFAVREWIGLIAYRLSGKTDTLFPQP